ncbi:aspartic peptidase domain-containing protein [Dendryphion nanum]|uniref:Aspartic peptidase domain-containing protein n=1 Tax=Dendryphion nanum TaxID=256645 RepID=A0A9P9IRA2_9PLEO|nr:aspartic peptidase domain-containing protein [Dendryphion nanum]
MPADLLLVSPPFLSGSLPSLALLHYPVVVKPDQFWGGIDGFWSTFMIRVGTPTQFHRVVVSTASQQTWTVYELGCKSNLTITNKLDGACNDDRGYTYNDTRSTSWKRRGYYRLWLESSLDMGGNGLYGYDNVGLGGVGEEGPTIKNCTVGTLISSDFWLGHLGVNPKPTNFTAFSEPSPSFMTYAFEQKMIPSVSFGYTAGVRYREEGTFLGSLTLGGYDASRFIPNELSFGFSPDNERDLVVGVVGITANGATKKNLNLMGAREQFTMFIDSTIAEIWLPSDICDLVAKAFNLKYNNATQLYLVDDLLHDTLLAENASITFSLGQRAVTNKTVDITLPYAAFDLTAKPPFRGLNTSSRYFPIRRGNQEKQFVFGRTFLQEAYLIVDWERQNFSVSQLTWQYGAPQNITAIYSNEYAHLLPKPVVLKKPLGTGAIIGIAIGGGFSLAMVVCGIIWCICRKRRQKRKAKRNAQYATQGDGTGKDATTEKFQQVGDTPASPTTKEEETTNVIPKAELPADSVRDGKEESLPSPTVEVENNERQIFEMPGDFPVRQEAGGRQLTEKESMVVRERIYNGVDPNETPAVSPLTEEPPSRRPPLLASDVTMFNRSMPSMTNVSPTTPRTPRDGAFLEAGDTFFQPPVPRGGRGVADDTLLSPISPLEGSTDTSRRRFSYES